MTAAPIDDLAHQRLLAMGTGLVLVSIYLKVILEPAFLLKTVLVIAQGCTPLLYARSKHLLNGPNQPLYFSRL